MGFILIPGSLKFKRKTIGYKTYPFTLLVYPILSTLFIMGFI